VSSARELEEERRHADATGVGRGTHQQAIDHALAAEKHAFGCAALLQDQIILASGDTRRALEHARTAVREAEREIVLARGMLTLPGPLVPADERRAALEVVEDAFQLFGAWGPEEKRPAIRRRLGWLRDVIARSG
jgi:alkylation response protein AidB-like acyl-CoA dehydrogenase